MQTQESYHNKWEPPFVFPWEQEYYERQMRKVKSESEKQLRKVQAESQKALKEAAERARVQSKLELAQAMLKKGLDASFVSEITGLEEQLILSLANPSV